MNGQGESSIHDSKLRSKVDIQHRVTGNTVHANSDGLFFCPVENLVGRFLFFFLFFRFVARALVPWNFFHHQCRRPLDLDLSPGCGWLN